MVDPRVAPPTSGRAGGVRVPDFFLVGHGKSGSTALYSMLRAHPQIFMPALKEPNFLASDMAPRVHKPGAPELPATMDEYLALFEDAAADQLVGEASVIYLRSHTAPAAIADLNPDARIVMMLREPASFIRSFHLQMLRGGNETVTSLRRALELEPVRRRGRRVPRQCVRPSLLQYSEHVRYLEQVRRFHAVFPRDQVHVSAYEEFLRDNEGSIKAVLRFLGVDHTVPVVPVQVNPSVKVRSQTVNSLLKRLKYGGGPLAHAARAPLRVFPQRYRQSLRSFVERRVMYAQPPVPDEELMAGLRRRMKPDVEALSDYLGMDFVRIWGYGDV